MIPVVDPRAQQITHAVILEALAQLAMGDSTKAALLAGASALRASQEVIQELEGLRRDVAARIEELASRSSKADSDSASTMWLFAKESTETVLIMIDQRLSALREKK